MSKCAASIPPSHSLTCIDLGLPWLRVVDLLRDIFLLRCMMIPFFPVSYPWRWYRTSHTNLTVSQPAESQWLWVFRCRAWQRLISKYWFSSERSTQRLTVSWDAPIPDSCCRRSICKDKGRICASSVLDPSVEISLYFLLKEPLVLPLPVWPLRAMWQGFRT